MSNIHILPCKWSAMNECNLYNTVDIKPHPPSTPKQMHHRKRVRLHIKPYPPALRNSAGNIRHRIREIQTQHAQVVMENNVIKKIMPTLLRIMSESIL